VILACDARRARDIEPFAGDLGISFPVAVPLWVGLAPTDVE